MSEYSDFRPEKNKPLPYGNDGLGIYPEPGVMKFFDDPDYIHLRLHNEPGYFTVDWATNLSPVEVIDSLDNIVKPNPLKKGWLSLLSMNGGVHFLRGSIDDVVGEIQEEPERVAAFELRNKTWSMIWRMPRQKFDFHDIESAECAVRVRGLNHMARIIVDQCIGLTSMEGLRNSMDVTLDEFAAYEPSLGREA